MREENLFTISFVIYDGVHVVRNHVSVTDAPKKLDDFLWKKAKEVLLVQLDEAFVELIKEEEPVS